MGWGLRKAAPVLVAAVGIACVGLAILDARRSPATGPPLGDRPVVAVEEQEVRDDDPLSAAERSGKALYEEGMAASGKPAMAVLGDNGTEVPASVVRCAGCHGQDGRGVAEGGLFPPNITWGELTKPYGSKTSSGRTRPAYTEALLKRSIGMGLDSSGRALQASMPRYRLGIGDADDLVAYLKRLGRGPTPGVTATTIRLASILPPESATSRNRAVAAALRASFDRVNDGGGIYGRRVELTLIAAEDSPVGRVAQARQLFERDDVFALVACDVSGAEGEIAGLCKEAAVPLVGALTLFPRDEPTANRQVLYLDGGVPGEAMILLDRARKGRPAGRPWEVALLVAPDERMRAVARSLEERVGGAGGRARTIERSTSIDPARLAEGLARDGVETLLILDAFRDALPTLRAAEAIGWRPEVLVPGSLADPSVFQVPAAFEARLLLAFGSSLPVGAGAALDGYRRLSGTVALPRDHVPEQLAALASSDVLVEAIKRAGRALTRQALLDQLDGFVDFPTAFSPPLSYHPRRRIGIRGAFVVGVKRESRVFERLSGWIEPGE